MRACRYSVDHMAKLAIRRLERNTSLLAGHAAIRLRAAAPVQNAKPFLIALDAIELVRVTDFQMSPWYSGTDLQSAVASDPIEVCGSCQELLAESIHNHAMRGNVADVVLPDAMVLRSDPSLRNDEVESAFCGDRVLYVVRQNKEVASWLSLFDSALRAASHAGAFEVGFCTTSLATDNREWTQEQLDGMIDRATCVFTAALDGEGYLVWER